MTNTQPNDVLKQDGLSPSDPPDALLEEVRSEQERLRRRERFWFRMACVFSIVAAISLVYVMVLLWASTVPPSSVTVTWPALTGSRPVATGRPITMRRERFSLWREPVGPPLIFIGTVSFAGALISCIWLYLSRRHASTATLQATLASLISEIRCLAQQRKE